MQNRVRWLLDARCSIVSMWRPAHMRMPNSWGVDMCIMMPERRSSGVERCEINEFGTGISALQHGECRGLGSRTEDTGCSLQG